MHAIPTQPGRALFSLIEAGHFDGPGTCEICNARGDEPCDPWTHDEHAEGVSLDNLAASVICLDCGTNFDQPSDCGWGHCCDCGKTWIEEID